MARHLLYHVWPVRGSSWRTNLDELKARLDLFDGVRAIAVATDETTVDLDCVREYFGAPAEWLPCKNVPGLREVVSFHALWKRVQPYCGVKDFTFTAHAKGVRHPAGNSVTVHDWARLCYATCLDYWPLVEKLLAEYPLAGPFKKRGYGFSNSQSRWHYSGTFYWARNRDVFARNWGKIDWFWYGTESWPGSHFRTKEAGCLFHEGRVGGMQLYDRTYMDGVLAEYAAWAAAHQGDYRGD